MARPDGGSAFPHVAELIDRMPDGEGVVRPITAGGMTLRSYYKAKAMQGLLAAGGAAQFPFTGDTTLAAAAGKIADAMIAEDDQ